MPNRCKLPRGALVRLRKADPALARVIDRVGPFRLEIGKAEGHLASLVRSIVYQQLSGKAAATIHGRLRALFPEDRYPTAAELLAQKDARLRACGLSRQKIGYLRDLCERVDSGALPLSDLDGMEDAAIMARLVEVKGIGRWSAEMFLMFHLGRLDVWPVGDLGVRKAIMRLHRHRELPTPKQMEPIGERYRPYRTVASWYLWRLLDADDGEW